MNFSNEFEPDGGLICLNLQLRLVYRKHKYPGKLELEHEHLSKPIAGSQVVHCDSVNDASTKNNSVTSSICAEADN